MSIPACRDLFDPCKGPPQLLPSGYYDSLQAINFKVCNVLEVEDLVADTICARRVTGLDPPVDPTDATNKEYVDSVARPNPGLPFGSIQFNDLGDFGGDADFTFDPNTNTVTLDSGTITGLNLPTNPTDAANKEYVDTVIGAVAAPPVNSVQFNNAGSFGGTSDFTWEDGSKTLTVDGTFTDTVLSINNGDIIGAADIDANGIINFTNTVNSTNPTTGTLVVTGGVGIGQDLNVGGCARADFFLTTSDATLKEDIVPLAGDSLEKLRQIECCSYKYKYDKYKKENYGVLAQQLEKIGLNHLVDNSNKYKAVNYINLIALLIDAVQKIDKRQSEERLKEISRVVTGIVGKKSKSINKLQSDLEDIIDSIKSNKVQELNRRLDIEIDQKITKDVLGPLQEIKNEVDSVKTEVTNDVKSSLKKELVNVNKMKQDISNNIKRNVKQSLEQEFHRKIDQDISQISNMYKQAIVEKSKRKISDDVRKNIRQELQDDISVKVTDTVNSVKSEVSDNVKMDLKEELASVNKMKSEISDTVRKNVTQILEKELQEKIDQDVSRITHKHKQAISEKNKKKISEFQEKIEQDVSNITYKYKQVIVEKAKKRIEQDVRRIKRDLQESFNENAKRTEETLFESLQQRLSFDIQCATNQYMEKINDLESTIKDIRKNIKKDDSDALSRRKRRCSQRRNYHH